MINESINNGVMVLRDKTCLGSKGKKLVFFLFFFCIVRRMMKTFVSSSLVRLASKA